MSTIKETKNEIKNTIKELNDKMLETKNEEIIELCEQSIKTLEMALNALEQFKGKPKKIDPSEIKKLKEEEGLTQEEIARKLNVSVSTIRRNWK